MKNNLYASLVLLFLCLFTVSVGCRGLHSQENLIEEGPDGEYAPGELIVKFKPEAFNEDGDLVSESIKELNEENGLISMESVFKGEIKGELAYIYVLRFPKEVNISELVSGYADDPSVVYAEPNYIAHAFPIM